MSKPFFSDLHAFRGVAVLCIMGAHAWSVLGYQSGLQAREPDYRWLYAGTEALFHGTTLFFALISGLLYTRVLRGQPWRAFFRGKLVHVIVPYAFVSTVLTALVWPEIVAWAETQKLTLNFPAVLAHNLATGQAEVHLWYIPVLAVLFALTPVLERLLRWRGGVALLVLAALPLVVSRTTYPQLLSAQTVVFFLGAYALGMVLGLHPERLHAFVAARRRLLLVVFVATLGVNFALFAWEYVADGFVSAQQSVVYVNKISAALLLLQALHARRDRIPQALLTLGTHAFSLYFLHFTVMVQLDQLLLRWHPTFSVPELAVAGLAVYALGTGLALLLSLGIRRALGRRSRWSIGA